MLRASNGNMSRDTCADIQGKGEAVSRINGEAYGLTFTRAVKVPNGLLRVAKLFCCRLTTPHVLTVEDWEVFESVLEEYPTTRGQSSDDIGAYLIITQRHQAGAQVEYVYAGATTRSFTSTICKSRDRARATPRRSQ